MDDGITEISKIRAQTLFPTMRDLSLRVLENFYLLSGRKLNITQTIRSFEDQQALYEKGRALVGGIWVVKTPSIIVTNAPPGYSWHNYGLAFDVAFEGLDPYLKTETKEVRDSLWELYGEIGAVWGLTWGGSFKLVNGSADLPHMQLTFGYSLTKLNKYYAIGGLKHVWEVLDSATTVS